MSLPTRRLRSLDERSRCLDGPSTHHGASTVCAQAHILAMTTAAASEAPGRFLCMNECVWVSALMKAVRDHYGGDECPYPIKHQVMPDVVMKVGAHGSHGAPTVLHCRVPPSPRPGLWLGGHGRRELGSRANDESQAAAKTQPP